MAIKPSELSDLIASAINERHPGLEAHVGITKDGDYIVQIYDGPYPSDPVHIIFIGR